MIKEFQTFVIVTATLIQLMILIACTSSGSMQAKVHQNPKSALERFYAFEGMEEQNMDMLILAGDEVVPLVMTEIVNKNMPRRRYAIGFLGNGQYVQALPVLQRILADSTERDLFRGDALLAIYQIDNDLGLRLASEHAKDQNFVGVIADDILRAASYINNRRTYQDALKSVAN